MHNERKTQGRKVNDLYNWKRSLDFFDFWKLSGFYSNLMWELFEVLSWFEETILQEKEMPVLTFSFRQLMLEVFLNVAGPEMF